MIRAAVCMSIMLVLMMGTVVCILVGDAGQLTGSGGIIMSILSVLTVLLSVGLTDRALMKKPPEETDAPPMPRVDPSIKYLMDTKHGMKP